MITGKLNVKITLQTSITKHYDIFKLILHNFVNIHFIFAVRM